MKLSEYYILKEKAEMAVDAKAHRFNKFCNNMLCSDCKYENSRDCFLDYVKDHDLEVE